MTGSVPRPPLPWWTAPLFVGGGIALIPWIVYLDHTLPQRQVSGNYRLAWVGFDVILLIQFARTGLFTLIRDTRAYVVVPASATSALLVVDAWFDITTAANRADRTVAILLAVFLEIPLAILCRWLAVRDVASPGRLTFLEAWLGGLWERRRARRQPDTGS
jgi:hypothetical protein